MLALAAGLGLALARPCGRGRIAAAGWVALVAAAAAVGGLAIGCERLGAIDAGALDVHSDRPVEVRGFVTAVPRRTEGEVEVRIDTADGRVAVQAPEPVPELPIGRAVRASGRLSDPPPWEAGYLRRFGIAEVLRTSRIELTGERRGGLAGAIDRVRDRAEAALEEGMPGPESALARGFVLGEDDRIDARTRTDFKRSGLAHILAVSGQNILLLALLAIPALAALGLRMRTRLICVLALIAIYVPVTGAVPSIQRAAVMGAAGIIAGLAGRPRSRWYAILLAAAVTLGLNPRTSADIGWQLSFAAVVGILLWAGPLREAILGATRARSGSRIRAAVAEGAALTIAATIATAPLMAHDFEYVSVASLPANLAVIPAIAPVMWLGMASAILGQVPFVPLAPLNTLNAVLIAYVAQIARWFATPGWAAVAVRLSSPLAVAAVYAAMLAAGSSMTASLIRRRGLAPPSSPRAKPRGRRARLAPALALLAGLLLLLVAPGSPLAGGEAEEPGSPPGLVVRVLDIGQGDSILLQPDDGAPVLVDAGPPGDEIASKLDDVGVERLAAIAVTHDQSDHAGGAPEALDAVDTKRFVYAEAGRRLLGAARAAGADLTRVAQGRTITSGSLRLDVLWPPPALLEPHPTPDEENGLSLVIRARWHRFSILLTGDAEAEEVPIDPGPIDVLKVSHHGSDDAGLDALLERIAPRLAVISVGAGNSYGHPTARTLETLAEHGIPVMRTDLDGNVEIDVRRSGWSARSD